MNKFILLAIAALVLAGCGKPTDTVIPTDITSWDKELAPSIKKLSDEDRNLFAAYMLRVKFGEAISGKGMAQGTTIGAAIKDQRDFMMQKAKDEAEKKALEEVKQKARKDAMSAMQGAVSVDLVEKKLEVERGASGIEIDEHLLIKFSYKNNTDKDITGVKGTVDVKDQFGDLLSGFNISNDNTIKAGETSYWTGSRSVKYSLGGNKDRKLAELPKEKYSVSWEPEMLIFADGTKLTAPAK